MFNFPSSPSAGQIYTDSATGAQYIYQNSVWRQVSAAQIQLGAQAKNRFVNPAFQISQENGSVASATAASNVGYYIADQWIARWNVSPGTISAQRYAAISLNNTPNTGAMVVIATKAVLAAGEYAVFSQYVEGINLADFSWGKPAAKPVVVRFWFYSTIAGLFSFRISNEPNTHAYVKQFTAAVGWNKIEAAIPGPTVGTWAVDNTAGLKFDIALAVGSTFVNAAAVNAWATGNNYAGPGQLNGMAVASTWYLADAGLYLDPDGTGVAPPWELTNYADDLLDCLRYWRYIDRPMFYLAGFTGTVMYVPTHWAPKMRVTPIAGAMATTNAAYTPAGGNATPSALSHSTLTPDAGYVALTVPAGTAGLNYGANAITMNARM